MPFAMVKLLLKHAWLQFEDDVYIATSEPHGDIEATVTRDHVQPHCKL